MTVTTSRISASAALRIKLELVAPRLRAATAGLWRPSGLTERYKSYLRAMHGVVRASVPLMELAARRCGELGAGDPIGAPLAVYLEEHIEEERHHDEWLLQDLAVAGCDPQEVLLDQPAHAVASVVGPQYYWVTHHHPVCLLGYMTVLEANAPPPWLADRLTGATGLPTGAFRTLSHHAVLDAGHSEALDTLLDTLPLSPAQESAVAVSGLQTLDAVAELFALLSRQGDPARAHTPAFSAVRSVRSGGRV